MFCLYEEIKVVVVVVVVVSLVLMKQNEVSYLFVFTPFRIRIHFLAITV